MDKTTFWLARGATDQEVRVAAWSLNARAVIVLPGQPAVKSDMRACRARYRVAYNPAMDDALRDQIRYLELRLQECSARPALHVRQISAYRAQLDLAHAVDTALDYLRALVDTGAMLAVTRAEWIDRYRNWGRIYSALGDEIRTETAAANQQAAETAEDDGGLMTALYSAKARHTPAERAADENAGLVQSLVAALLEWRAATEPPYRAQHERAVSALWQTLQNNDPRCDWQRICTYPPYRHRLPFAARGLATLRDWLAQVVGTRADRAPGADDGADDGAGDGAARGNGEAFLPAPSGGGPTDAVELAIPSAQQAAYAYHLTYDALDRSDPDNRELCGLYERVFELEQAAAHGPALLRAMAESDMYCQLTRAPQLVAVRRGLRRILGRSQPHAEYHYRQLEQALLACRSPTEVEYEVERASRMFAVEVAWNDSLLRPIARVLVAVSGYVAEPDEVRRRAVVASYQAACQLLDATWEQVMAAPRVWDMFCRVWFAQGRLLNPDSAGQWGGDFGDLGGGALSGIREATVQRMLEKSAATRTGGGHEGGNEGDDDSDGAASEMRPEALFETAEEMYGYLSAGLRRALTGEASADTGATSAAPEPLVLWGRSVALEQLHEELSRPQRPAIVFAEYSAPQGQCDGQSA